jgi:hypothetical protein
MQVQINLQRTYNNISKFKVSHVSTIKNRRLVTCFSINLSCLSGLATGKYFQTEMLLLTFSTCILVIPVLQLSGNAFLICLLRRRIEGMHIRSCCFRNLTTMTLYILQDYK